MRKYIVIIVLLISSMVSLKAQLINITYEIEPGIEKVEKAHQSAWLKVGKIEGYRIQIIAISGINSQKRAQDIADEFMVKFPDIAVYLSYAEPNFRVRAGNFRTKLDALMHLGTVRVMYPGAFIVKDKIFYTDF